MSEPNIYQIPSSAQAAKLIQQELQQEIAQVVESEADLDQYLELSVFNPLLQNRRFREFEDLKSQSKKQEQVERKPEAPRIDETAEAKEVASRFQQKNEELHAKTLLILLAQLTAEDTPEEILNKVLTVYPDPSLADEALDFLVEAASPSMRPAIQEAKSQLHATREREIVAGRNIQVQAREFAKGGLGPPTSLRDLYRDVTGNPREPLKLFEELTEKFPYTKLRTAIQFLLHSLGSDLKSKGPSIAPGELKRLLDETRSLQGILSIFRFFQSRMNLIRSLFVASQLPMPDKVTFEVLARLLVRMLAERFMNPEKILQTARALGIEEEVAAQIIVYTQMKDALRQIAPKYFRNPTHREELTQNFLALLEDLEEKEEEKGKGKKGKKKEEKKG